jgi:rhodanese-related sulfurtransferase
MNDYAVTTAEQLKTRLDTGEKPYLIDVREDDEVAFGMIEGAVHIPMGQIPARMDEIPRDREVVFICRSGSRSGRVCEFLAQQGFDRTVNMEGGMLAWGEL